MTKRFLIVGGLLALSGCGVPSDPEKGPVVLLCDGEQANSAASGEVERQKLTQFYKIDGVERTLETWDEKDQSWSGSLARITITPNEITRRDEPKVDAVVITQKTITFDRAAGRVHDEFAMSNGGAITFDGACKPVKSPTSERKF